MLPELGHLAAVTALALALAQSWCVYSADMRAARNAVLMQLWMLVLAWCCLTAAFMANDFSVAYVAHNSNSQLPWHYRISAVWGAHNGSLLLWILVHAGWSAAAATFLVKVAPPRFVARTLGVLGMLSAAYLLLLLLLSNPFLRHPLPPSDGADLNPLLQDPGLIIHPPMLYLGYVGTAVGFAIVIAAMLERVEVLRWSAWLRPWALASWMFLGCGIALGSWWAYYELGWGGWWFWDPVENASFMPWLCGTALLHVVAAAAKRGLYAAWAILLAVCTFALSLLGAFLVRSGILNSVHTFAVDPGKGLYLLALFAAAIGGGLLLFAFRAPPWRGTGSPSLLARETLLLGNSVVLFVAMATVFLGTLYPLLLDAVGAGKISVGEPYFNAVFVPLMVPAALLPVLGVATRWQGDSLARMWPTLRQAGVAAVVMFVAVLAMFHEQATFLGAAFGLALSAWLAYGSIAIAWQRRRSLGRSTLAATLAHCGLAVTVAGIAVTSAFSSEAHLRMRIGDSHTVGGISFELQQVQPASGPNYSGIEAVVGAFSGNRQIAELRPQKRLYEVRQSWMTEAGIEAGLWRDLYVAIGEVLDDGSYGMRLQVKPMVRWIWLGAIIMALGAIVGLWPQRGQRQAAAVP